MELIKKINFNRLGDNRGKLISIEQNNDIPFKIKRVYYLYDTNKDISRGYHAHKNLEQVAICLKGSCKIVLDDGKNRDSVILSSPEFGLYIDNNKWREIHDFSSDCVLLVLASEYYCEQDYIRNYQDFLEFSKE